MMAAHCHSYQLADLWKKKKDIYSVVKALGKRTNLESTDAIWGCWAWVVRYDFTETKYSSLTTSILQQMKLIDFSELVVKGDQDKEKFWDWVDSELESLHNLHKDKTESSWKDAISL